MQIHFANRFVLLFLFLLINLKFFRTIICRFFARIIVLIILLNLSLSRKFIKILIDIKLLEIIEFTGMIISLLVEL